MRPMPLLSVVTGALESALDWQPGNWTQVAGGYRPHWSMFSRERFEQIANPWPMPTRRK
jgi:hypothetical protein